MMKLAVAIQLLLSPLPSYAEDAYPARSVQVVVPYPAGGSTDPLVRIICDRLSKNLGQTFVAISGDPSSSAAFGMRSEEGQASTSSPE